MRDLIYYFLTYVVKPVSEFYFIQIFLIFIALALIAFVIKKTISSKGVFEKNLPYTLLNIFIYTNLVILSFVVSQFVFVKIGVDMRSGVAWYSQLLFGEDNNAGILNFIPMAIWGIVTLIKYFALSGILFYIQAFCYRFLLRKFKKANKAIKIATKTRGWTR